MANFSIGILEFVLKLATCPIAWTPASVLPDPISSISSFVISDITFSIFPWIFNLFGCFCQPLNSFPTPKYPLEKFTKGYV